MGRAVTRLAGRVSAAAALAVLLATALPVRAGLFDDDEARKAILDLRARVDKVDVDARARLEEQNRQVNEQIGQLRRSVLELNSTIEQLRAELARMRGQDEQVARDVAELQRRQKDVISGVDERIRKLEPVSVTLDGATFMADPEEKRQYDESLAVFRGGDFDKAVGTFGSFVRRWPASGYRESALFWLGNAQYARRDYKEAITSFRALVGGAPAHPKAPEALLAVANCQVELKDRPSARRTLDELIKSYPGTEAALAARERLAAIRG